MRKQLIFVAFLSLLVTLWHIVSSFAIFESDIPFNINTPLAKWQILVNNINITGVENKFNVEAINWSENEFVLPGVAAPGLNGYFEVFIDPSSTEVSFEYEILIDFDELGNEEIKLVSVLDKNGQLLDKTDGGTYKGLFLLSDIENGKQEKIRFNVIWENNEENSDIDSTFVDIEDSYLRIPLKIKFSQFLG